VFRWQPGDDLHAMAFRQHRRSDTVKRMLKSELKRKNIGYRELAERLAAMGVHDSERNIANKISRDGFTAVFLVQCLEAVGASSLRLER
jgi:Domain of unknown function (DUF6471)